MKLCLRITHKPEVQADINRVVAIWRECREKYSASGEFLFGHFTIADAMHAPVVLRFRSYGVPLEPIVKAYANSIWNLPSLQQWVAAAAAETERIAAFDR